MAPPARGWRTNKVTAVLLAVLAVAVMASALRVSQDRLDYAVSTADVGQTMPIRGGELTVDDVRVGTQLTREGRVVSQTRGMFVVVSIRLAATGNRDLTLTGGNLLSRDGFTYNLYDFSSIKAVSGFQTTDDAVFEVDPAHIDDLTLQIWESELVAGYQQRNRVHLGITAGNAEQWRAAAQGRGVEPRPSELSEALS